MIIFNKSAMEVYQVVGCPSNELSYTNRAILNPSDNFAKFEHIAIRYPKRNEAFVFSVITDQAVARGSIAFNASGRKWASILLSSSIEAAPYQFEPQSQCLSSITFLVDFANRATAPANLDFDTEDMAKQFSQQFINQAFTVGQIFGFPYVVNNRRIVFELKVKELEAMNLEKSSADVSTLSVEIGLTTPNTIFMFDRLEGSPVKLVGNLTGIVAAPMLFAQDWDFASMGVGGLGEQFNKMFRRAFASRLLPPKLAQAIGSKHVRGILLYGPPGTGKTLIARQIGKMLLAREPKIVNGPEVLNKFVGESEANIRKLFAEAEEEQAKMGINSGLHMIIFDEIDSICKARGSSASSSGVGDNVVNQLLSKIDGVNSLHNVLLIGMTNRRDLIDEALLRPGRLELQIEIGLPNREGRLEIFKIHIKEMRDNKFLDPSVDLESLAERTKNYTGAEIAGLIEAARSLAINRVVKIDQKVELDKEKIDSIKVTQADFEYAMKHDVKPALGASEDQVRKLAAPMLEWDPVVVSIQTTVSGIIKQVTQRDKWRPYFVLLSGDPGAGLTTIAANMAAATRFPFIRVHQPKVTAGMTENMRVQHMEKLFDDAARSELSCIVLDGLEPILDYSHIGPRFSNTLRTVFASNTDFALNEGHHMLVICTCKSEQFLNDLQIFDVFDEIIRVPSLARPEQVDTVLRMMNHDLFTPQQMNDLVGALGSIPFKMGIKKLERLIENASRDESDRRVKLFLERMHERRLVIRKSRLGDLEF